MRCGNYLQALLSILSGSSWETFKGTSGPGTERPGAPSQVAWKATRTIPIKEMYIILEMSQTLLKKKQFTGYFLVLFSIESRRNKPTWITLPITKVKKQLRVAGKKRRKTCARASYDWFDFTSDESRKVAGVFFNQSLSEVMQTQSKGKLLSSLK